MPPLSLPAAQQVDLYARAVHELFRADDVEVSPCLVCGHTRARGRFCVEGVSAPVVVCGECGLGRFEPMFDAEAIRAFYPDEYYGQPGVKFHPVVERLVRSIGARHIAFLSRGLAENARVLDVGCGRGVILGPLADRGFQVHGIEVSAEASRGVDPRAEIRIVSQLADAGYPDAFFDEVVIWHVLEHVADPKAMIEEARRILKPRGRLIVAVPNFSSAQARWSGAAWFHLDLPRHLYHFPLGALRRLLEGVGFEVSADHHFSLRQNPFGWIQSALNQIPGLPRNGLYTMLHRRGHAERRVYSASQRAVFWTLSVLLAPLALLATLLESATRSGATVHVVAFRRPESEAPPAA